MTKEPWKSYGESKDVTDKVKDRGGSPEPEPSPSPEWFQGLAPEVKRFLQDVTDDGIALAAKFFRESGETREKGKESRHMSAKSRFDEGSRTKPSGEWGYGMPEEAPEAPQTDELAEALQGLLQAGKKVLRAVVNELLS